MKMLMTQMSNNDDTDGTSQSAQASVGNRWNPIGQSTIEYLIVAGAIVAALLVVRWQFQARASNLMNSAINRIP